jgi:predicted phosphodiesterase
MHRVDQLARSSARHLFLGLGKDDNLIFGHTHRPFVDEHVANTGSWVSDSQVQNTYLIVDEGKMRLKHFESK